MCIEGQEFESQACTGTKDRNCKNISIIVIPLLTFVFLFLAIILLICYKKYPNLIRRFRQQNEANNEIEMERNEENRREGIDRNESFSSWPVERIRAQHAENIRERERNIRAQQSLERQRPHHCHHVRTVPRE